MDKETCDILTNSVRRIAETRRIYEIKGKDLALFDQFLNEESAKWYEHYASKGPNEIVHEGLLELFDLLTGKKGK